MTLDKLKFVLLVIILHSSFACFASDPEPCNDVFTTNRKVLTRNIVTLDKDGKVIDIDSDPKLKYAKVLFQYENEHIDWIRVEPLAKGCNISLGPEACKLLADRPIIHKIILNDEILKEEIFEKVNAYSTTMFIQLPLNAKDNELKFWYEPPVVQFNDFSKIDSENLNPTTPLSIPKSNLEFVWRIHPNTIPPDIRTSAIEMISHKENRIRREQVKASRISRLHLEYEYDPNSIEKSHNTPTRVLRTLVSEQEVFSYDRLKVASIEFDRERMKILLTDLVLNEGILTDRIFVSINNKKVKLAYREPDDKEIYIYLPSVFGDNPNNESIYHVSQAALRGVNHEYYYKRNGERVPGDLLILLTEEIVPKPAAIAMRIGSPTASSNSPPGPVATNAMTYHYWNQKPANKRGEWPW